METLDLKVSLKIEDSEELAQALRRLERYLKNAGITVEWPMEAPVPGELGGKWPGYLLMAVATFSELNHALERIEHYWEQDQHTVFIVHSSDEQTNEDTRKEIERKNYHIHVEEPTTGGGTGEIRIGSPPVPPVLKLRVKTADSQKRVDNLSDLERHLQDTGIIVKPEKSDGEITALLLIVDQSVDRALGMIDNALGRVHNWQMQHPNIPVVLRLTGTKKWLDDHIQQEIKRKNYSIELERP